ncbi:MAG: AsmA family protein [Magnetococcales bacterium]|nr:AsmA family protein [Magnetococcales bacterium]
MNRKQATIVIGLSLTAVVVIVLHAALPSFLDSQFIKEQIARLIREKTGRPMVIEGNLTFSFFPNVEIHLGPSRFQAAEGTASGPEAAFESAILVVRGTGLLLGRLDVVELALEDLRITLERGADGITRWPDLGSIVGKTSWGRLRELASGHGSDGEPDSDIRTALSGLAAISMGKLQVEGARIHWRDRHRDIDHLLENVSILSHPLDGGGTGIEVSGNWKRSPIDAWGRVLLDYQVHEDGDTLEMANVHLVVTSHSEKIFLRESELRFTAGIDLDFGKRRVEAKDLELVLTGWFTDGSLRDMKTVVKGTALWEVDSATGTMDNVRLTSTVHTDELPPAGLNLSLRSAVTWREKEGVLNLSRMSLQGPADIRLAGDLDLRGLRNGWDDVTLSGSLASELFDPKALFLSLGQKLPRVFSQDLFAKGKFHGSFKADRQGIVLEPLHLDLDDTQMEGRLNWSRGTHDAVDFQLSMNHVDVDRYWDPMAPGNKLPENKPLAVLLIPEIALSGLLQRLPDDLRLKGILEGKKVRLSGAEVENFTLGMALEDRLLNLEPFQFGLYDGNWKQKVQIDGRGDETRMLVEKEMKGIQIQPFFKTIAGVDWLSGIMDLSGRVETSGNDSVSSRKNLKGSYWLGMKNGAFHGLDLTRSIRDLVAGIEGRPIQAAPVREGVDDPVTSFSELTATARVGQGRLLNSDLLAVSNSSVIKGKGEVDLLALTVDYTFQADAQAALKGMDVPYWDRLEGAVLPISIVGPLSLSKKPQIGEPQLTRKILAARQNQNNNGAPLPAPNPFIDAPPFVPMAESGPRNRHPMSRFKRGLFPWD